MLSNKNYIWRLNCVEMVVDIDLESGYWQGVFRLAEDVDSMW